MRTVGVAGARAIAIQGHRLEDAVAISVLGAMVVLAALEITSRIVAGGSVPGSIVLVQQLTLWITVIGAAVAARSDRLLALATPQLLPLHWRPGIRILTYGLGAAIIAALAVASLDLARVEHRSGDSIPWGIPSWAAVAILPVGFAFIALRLIWHAAPGARGRLGAAACLLVPLALGIAGLDDPARFVLPSVAVIAIAATLGMPLVAVVGGIALVCFWGDATPLNAVPGEAYRLTTSPMLPAIPLFAVGGYILAEGGASRRLTHLFTALFGWMPGGLAIVTTLVLAFFTPLTGASGITILSMGGLLLPVLLAARYPEGTSIGLVTVSGSIGLLFFPSLPVFLYSFYATVPVERVFVAGVVPGILLVAVVAGWAAATGWRHGVIRTEFRWREAASAIGEAKWDLLLPVLVLAALVTGLMTLVEAAAFAVLCAVVIECVIHRSLGVRDGLPRAVIECAALIGGFMIILGTALAFTNYLVIAQIPDQILSWAQARIDSPAVFLLALNLFLIIVGGLMDIYSAIVVVVPLILPLAHAYGIEPVHLAVIFLANMELGYLMPPMGENLFLASYRFDQPLTRIYRSTLPYTAGLLIAVLVITYVPALSLWLVGALERSGHLTP
jgi:tripartite ATP-independent transporter DctM subunit